MTPLTLLTLPDASWSSTIPHDMTVRYKIHHRQLGWLSRGITVTIVLNMIVLQSNQT